MKECSKVTGDCCFCSYTVGAAADWEFGMAHVTNNSLHTLF